MLFDVSCLHVVPENIEGNKNFESDAGNIIKTYAHSYTCFTFQKKIRLHRSFQLDNNNPTLPLLFRIAELQNSSLFPRGIERKSRRASFRNCPLRLSSIFVSPLVLGSGKRFNAPTDVTENPGPGGPLPLRRR